MSTINKDELFSNIRQFLKTKGIELQEGSYARTIQKGCQVLTDTINLTQQAVERARSEVERNLERVRQTIHQKTAPRKASTATAPNTAAPGKPPVMSEVELAEKPPTPKAKSTTKKPRAKTRARKRTGRAE